MAWKRALHKKNGTTLIETYSYFNKLRSSFIELDKILKKNGVTYNKEDYREIFKRMVIDKDDRTYSAFRKLVITFINLFKSNGYDEEVFHFWKAVPIVN
jgi:DNA helicase-4